MEITIICSDKNHKIYPMLESWKEKNSSLNQIKLVNYRNEIQSGDILFLISCTEFINKEIRNKFQKTLLIHESDLPEGRGWSPLQWIIVEGNNTVPLTLLEAVDKIDAGPIWIKRFVNLEGHELVDEITTKVFSEKLNLMDFAVKNFNSVIPYQQTEDHVTYYKKRTPNDSEINVEKSIAEQFDKLRIADERRYPCFFKFRNHTYKITLEKISEN